MNIIQRDLLSTLEERMFKRKALLIKGARQTGKTTLIKTIASKYSDEVLYLNCDEPDIRNKLTDINSLKIKNIIGDKKIILIDEAQRVKNIGITVKLFVDNFPKHQIILTGSSSFELANELYEPLTGRIYDYTLYPFSWSELVKNTNRFEMSRNLETRILYGMYPEIVTYDDDKEILLKKITQSYLFKDIFRIKELRKPEVIENLILALAYQIGNLVSYQELSKMLKIDIATVEKYIQLLESSYIIFKLPPFSRNLRNELTKMRKIYFYDTGVRNAIISDFTPLNLRNDSGALWENFLISEKIKHLTNNNLETKLYFWRTQQQQEIDLIEINKKDISAFEFKWSSNSKGIISKTFINNYKPSIAHIIHNENFEKFLGIE